MNAKLIMHSGQYAVTTYVELNYCIMFVVPQTWLVLIRRHLIDLALEYTDSRTALLHPRATRYEFCC